MRVRLGTAVAFDGRATIGESSNGNGGDWPPRPLMTASTPRPCVTIRAWNYAARVLPIRNRGNLAFFAGFVATGFSSVGAAAAVLSELSTEVVSISR